MEAYTLQYIKRVGEGLTIQYSDDNDTYKVQKSEPISDELSESLQKFANIVRDILDLSFPIILESIRFSTVGVSIKGVIYDGTHFFSIKSDKLFIGEEISETIYDELASRIQKYL